MKNSLSFYLATGDHDLTDSHKLFTGALHRMGHNADTIRGILTEDSWPAVDAVVTPGNSFGHMTGGFDAAVVKITGTWCEEAIRKKIADGYFNELNVGDAVLVSNPMARINHVVYAPTMRIPKKLPYGTDVPYLATLAAMRQIHLYNRSKNPLHRIYSVLLPMFGVGTGQIPVSTALSQQLAAIHRYTYGEPVTHLFLDGKRCDEGIDATWGPRFGKLNRP